MGIDWSNAPEGATHYLPKQPDLGWSACWYKKDGNTWHGRVAQDFDDGRVRWYIDEHDVEQFVPLLIAKPEPTSWNGEGLPPVGTVCECQNDDLKWLEGTVVHVGYHGSTKLAVMQAKEEILYGEVGEFRPIKTKEQLAAEEEREKVVEEMLRIFATGVWDGGAPAGCKALYDAGYRKQEDN